MADEPLAFANFRERLEPQLHRLGVAPDWSMAGCPTSPAYAGPWLVCAHRAGHHQRPEARSATHWRARQRARQPCLITIDNDGRPFVADSAARPQHAAARRGWAHPNLQGARLRDAGRARCRPLPDFETTTLRGCKLATGPSEEDMPVVADEAQESPGARAIATSAGRCPQRR